MLAVLYSFLLKYELANQAFAITSFFSFKVLRSLQDSRAPITLPQCGIMLNFRPFWVYKIIKLLSDFWYTTYRYTYSKTGKPLSIMKTNFILTLLQGQYYHNGRKQTNCLTFLIYSYQHIWSFQRVSHIYFFRFLLESISGK